MRDHLKFEIGTGQVLHPVPVPDLFPKCDLQPRITAPRSLRKHMHGVVLSQVPRVLVNGNHLPIQTMPDDHGERQTEAEEILPNERNYEG